MAAAMAATAAAAAARQRRRRRQHHAAAVPALLLLLLLLLPLQASAQGAGAVRSARRPGAPPACSVFVPPGGQCGGSGGDCARYGTCGGALGPWGQGFCCTQGYTCQAGETANGGSGGGAFQVWRCLEGALDGAPTVGDRQALPWPPRPLGEFACTARVDSNGRRVPGRCPSPWTTAPQGFTQVPSPLRVEAEPGEGARLVTAGRAGTQRRPALLRGFNNFGWNVGDNNVGGLGWAYCDDNAPGQSPACKPGDADIPPWWDEKDPQVSSARAALNASYWGKRTLTNDFSTVVWRQRILGFNAVRIPFAFDALAADLPPSAGGKSEFALCQRDDPADIAVGRTLDPSLRPTVFAAAQELDAQLPGGSPEGLPPPFPPYLGMPHPPPIDALTSGGPADSVQAAQLPWQAPLKWQAPAVAGRPTGYPNGTSVLRLTQCNYYLPAEGQALHRLLWQVQHYVASGLYVILSFHPVLKTDANFRRPALLENNWRYLWRSLVALPEWRQYMSGRVFPDLINEPGIAGCEWGAEVRDAKTGEVQCAPAIELFAKATAAIRESEPSQIIFLNGLGQPAGGGGAWGDGFLTNRAVLGSNATDASAFFSPAAGKDGAPPNFVLAPHTYGGTITGWGLEYQQRQALWKRFEASFARKASGGDVDASGKQLPAVFPWLLGEFGARDDGAAIDLYAPASIDSTAWSGPDLTFLRDVADFLRREGGTAADKARLRVARASRERPGWLRIRQGGVALGDGVPPPTPADGGPGQPKGMMQLAWRDSAAAANSPPPTVADVGATGGYSDERSPWSYWISGSKQPGSSLIWAWNANAADTRGLIGGVSTQKAVQWRKIEFLTSEFGLRPWYCEVLEASSRPVRKC